MKTALLVALWALMAALAGPSVAAAHEPGETLRHYGTATVDGVITDGEYGTDPVTVQDSKEGTGCLVPTHLDLIGGEELDYVFHLCETNDAKNTYYAVEIDDISPTDTSPDPLETDSMFMVFDNEHDGDVMCPQVQDMIVAQGDGTFQDDAFHQGGPGSSCGALPPVTVDATVDGTAAVTFTPRKGYVYEMSHPIASGDAQDYQAKTHDTIGYCFVYHDSSNPFSFVIWPWFHLCASPINSPFPSADAGAFADVVIAGWLDAFLDKIRSLVDSCDFCPPDVRRQLREELDVAYRAYGGGDDAGVASAMRSFIDATRGFVRAGTLAREQGHVLQGAAQDVFSAVKSKGASAHA